MIRLSAGSCIDLILHFKIFFHLFILLAGNFTPAVTQVQHLSQNALVGQRFWLISAGGPDTLTTRRVP